MIKVFCDFDGTVSVEDIGNKIFQQFGGEEAHQAVADYTADKIGGMECLIRECSSVNNLTQRLLEEFIHQFQLDPGFSSFTEFCKDRDIPIVIVSDGMDIYVEPVLKRFGYGELRFFANEVKFIQTDGLNHIVPLFPFADDECRLCGNCKRNHMLTLAGDDDIIVYVGNGLSDRCPVGYADIVFAKSSLLRYCSKEGIDHFEFHNFRDVQNKMAEILKLKRIKKNRRAEFARRETFLCE
jgi:2,3-diketo-5-methylthio-1-phosphopentane phosphatase